MSNAQGMPGGGGMLKLRFDRYITAPSGEKSDDDDDDDDDDVTKGGNITR